MQKRFGYSLEQALCLGRIFGNEFVCLCTVNKPTELSAQGGIVIVSTRWLAWVPALSTRSACRRHPLSRTRPTLRPRVSLPTWSLSWRCAYLNPLVAAVSLALPACTFLFFSFLFSAFSLETRRGLRCSRRVSPPLCLFVPPLLSSACGGPHWCAAACVPCRTRRRVAAAAAASGRQGFPVLRCAALLRPTLPLPGPIPPPPLPRPRPTTGGVGHGGAW